MNCYIITGTSRGLGEAIAYELLSKDTILYCLSRNKNVKLIKEAEERDCLIHYDTVNLEDPVQIKVYIKLRYSDPVFNNADSIYLINSAGLLKPIKRIGDCSILDLQTNIQVNLLAVMALCSGFVSNFQHLHAEKRILNISSGAAKKPYSGWSAYCSAKAGVDMYSRCLALEQDAEEYPVKVVSLAPGVIDTKMQSEIRSSNKKDFDQIERFMSLYEEGMLSSPKNVAEKILTFLHTEEYPSGEVLDLRNR